MAGNKTCGGRALRISVGITALVLLLAGGASARFINDNATGGDCTSIGTWNAASKICTLTTDLTATIEIDSDGITLNGNGHTIAGSNYTGNGIYLSGRNGVTIKNTNVRNFSSGIYLASSSNNTLSGNNASNNIYGIYLNSSSNTILINNTANSNGIVSFATAMWWGDGIDIEYSSNNTLSGNSASNNVYGIYLGSSSNNTLSGNTANSNENYGIYLGSSSNNTLSGNTANSNRYGISFYFNNNTLSGSTGIYLSSSSNNILINNTANSNGVVESSRWWGDGIGIEYSSNNTLSGNTANGNVYGIDLAYSSNNILTNNTANQNFRAGIYLGGSNNAISNNIFNNYNNAYTDAPNKWNTTKTSGTNIVGGPYLGGNFWANPSGTGFSQTCTDADGDGICDLPYTLYSSNIDYLPLAPALDLVFATSPNSRIAQIGVPITLYLSIINGGTATATNVSISQASNLPAIIHYQPWDGSKTFTGVPDTPVNIIGGETVHFVLTIDVTALFPSSPMTFNVSSTNGATAPINGVNALTISGTVTPYADVVMESTSLNVSTPVKTPTAFAVATTNVGAVNATNVSFNVVVPDSMTGLAIQVNQTNPTTGAIIGPAIELTINAGDQPTFAVFLTPTHPIAFDPANNRIILELMDGSGKIIGAQSVAVSTT